MSIATTPEITSRQLRQVGTMLGKQRRSLERIRDAANEALTANLECTALFNGGGNDAATSRNAGQTSSDPTAIQRAK